MNSPIPQPKTTNQTGVSTTRIATPATVRPTRETMMVGLAPSRSSIQAKPTAPRPAATLSRMPNFRISSKLMPKVPAA